MRFGDRRKNLSPIFLCGRERWKVIVLVGNGNEGKVVYRGGLGEVRMAFGMQGCNKKRRKNRGYSFIPFISFLCIYLIGINFMHESLIIISYSPFLNFPFLIMDSINNLHLLFLFSCILKILSSMQIDGR